VSAAMLKSSFARCCRPTSNPFCARSASNRCISRFNGNVCCRTLGRAEPLWDDGPTQSTATAATDKALAYAQRLYKFSRPHTMLGTFVSIVSVSIMAMQVSKMHGCGIEVNQHNMHFSIIGYDHTRRPANDAQGIKS